MQVLGVLDKDFCFGVGGCVGKCQQVVEFVGQFVVVEGIVGIVFGFVDGGGMVLFFVIQYFDLFELVLWIGGVDFWVQVYFDLFVECCDLWVVQCMLMEFVEVGFVVYGDQVQYGVYGEFCLVYGLWFDYLVEYVDGVLMDLCGDCGDL